MGDQRTETRAERATGDEIRKVVMASTEGTKPAWLRPAELDFEVLAMGQVNLLLRNCYKVAIQSSMLAVTPSPSRGDERVKCHCNHIIFDT